MRRNVAIACQGGGSHTAFTAGVLCGVLQAKSRGEPFDIVALSGTSGGAICALLAWQGLISGDLSGASDNLRAFWTKTRPRGNAVATMPVTPIEVFDFWLNSFLTWGSRSHLPGTFPVTFSPRFNPYFSNDVLRVVPPAMEDFVAAISDGRRVLKSLIQQYVDDRAIRDAVRQNAEGPDLLIGAVDVCTGEFQVFRSKDNGFGLDAIIASAAIPDLMQAVSFVYESPEGIRRGTYWDGLFSQNPPLRDLAEALAEDCHSGSSGEEHVEREIWIIRINPRTRDSEPRQLEEILDRRNELSGNLSLEQETYFIEKINEWLKEGRMVNPTDHGMDDRSDASRCTRHYHQITLRSVELPSEMLEQQGLTLDSASKLERQEYFLSALVEAGEQLAEQLTQPKDNLSKACAAAAK